MRPRHLPRLWLMTDERMGDRLLPAVAALPRGAGVVFRHLATPRRDRLALFLAVRAVARARRLVLLVAGDDVRRAGGVYVSIGSSKNTFVLSPSAALRRALSKHRPATPPVRKGGQAFDKLRPNGVGLRAASVHGARELAAARAWNTDLVFVSPVHPTRTHPGAPALGRVRFAALATRAHAPVIALGGMTAVRFRGLPAHGWAAVDGLTPKNSESGAQNLKAVPR